MPTRKEEMEAWALDDYKEVLGRTIHVSEFTGYVDNDSVDFSLEEPVEARVTKTPETDILHWNRPWLDPYWNLEILKIPPAMMEAHPKLGMMTSTYMFGDSYSLDGKYQPAGYEHRFDPREWSPRGEVWKRKRE